MKIIKYLSLLFITSLCLGFAACSNDDDDEGSEYASLILGSWRYEEEDYIETYTFYSNGTYSYSDEEWYNNSWYSDDIDGTYQLRGDKLTLVEDDGDTDQYTIVKLTDTKLILEYDDDDEGERCTYTKVDDDEEDEEYDEASIIGTWLYEEEDWEMSIKFTSQGTFTETEKEYYNGKWYTDTYTGTYRLSGSKLYMTYEEDDETETVEILSLTSSTLKVKAYGETMTFTRQ